MVCRTVLVKKVFHNFRHNLVSGQLLAATGPEVKAQKIKKMPLSAKAKLFWIIFRRVFLQVKNAQRLGTKMTH
jgi:hypothetical protein